MQGVTLYAPWVFPPIGNTLFDWVMGIHTVNINGGGDHAVVTGGYSGINIFGGG